MKRTMDEHASRPFRKTVCLGWPLDDENEVCPITLERFWPGRPRITTQGPNSVSFSLEGARLLIENAEREKRWPQNPLDGKDIDAEDVKRLRTLLRPSPGYLDFRNVSRIPCNQRCWVPQTESGERERETEREG